MFVILILCAVSTAPALAQQDLDLDAFFRAVTDGRTEIVRSGLEAHPEWIQEELFFGIRPLYRASVLARPEVVQLLLEAGADPAEATDRGSQALHAASQNGDLATAMLLLSHKAPVDAQNEDGYTPLHLAARYKHLDLMKELLRSGADPNVLDHRGRSPLHVAAGLGRLDLVTALVEGGAELNIVDNKGYSALGWARTTKRNSYGDVGGYLEARGALDERPPGSSDAVAK